MADGLGLVEAAILAAVANGVDTIEGLARLLRMDRGDVERVVEELKAKGLLVEEEKGFIIRRRRLRLTREGYEALGRARRLLEEAAKSAREVLERVRREGRGRVSLEELEGLLAPELLAVLPLLQFIGLIPLLELPLILEAAEELDWDSGEDVEGDAGVGDGDYGV